MDKPSISTLVDAISGYSAQFVAYVLNGNEALLRPTIDISEPPSFYCAEIVRQMANTDPHNFAVAVVNFLRKCTVEGCFDTPDKELMEK